MMRGFLPECGPKPKCLKASREFFGPRSSSVLAPVGERCRTQHFRMAGGAEKTHHGKLVEGQGLATSLEDARTRGAREAQRGDAQLGDLEEATGSHC
jgi:hypothetical protein